MDGDATLRPDGCDSPGAAAHFAPGIAGVLLAALVAMIPARAQASDPDLTGTWAQRTVLTSVTDAPVIGEVISRTVGYMRVEIRQDGQDVRLRTRVCDMDVRGDFSAVRTSLPPPFVQAIPTVVRTGRLVEEGGETYLQIDKRYHVLGARLQDPSSDALPTGVDDPRVVDADRDGHPGVTVRISGLVSGRIYLVQRGWDAFRGRLVDDNRIRGRVQWGVQQEVLDSTSIFLNRQPATRPHSEPRRSHFEMIRISDETSCRTVRSASDRLFAR